MHILAALCAAYCPNFEELIMKIKQYRVNATGLEEIKDWLTIAFVFGISLGVLLGYALKTFLG